jgi:hypothetical protein
MTVMMTATGNHLQFLLNADQRLVKGTEDAVAVTLLVELDEGVTVLVTTSSFANVELDDALLVETMLVELDPTDVEVAEEVDESEVLLDVEVLGTLVRVRVEIDELSVLEKLASGTLVVSRLASLVKLACIALTSIVCMRLAADACCETS